jgi:hypothetical protein
MAPSLQVFVLGVDDVIGGVDLSAAKQGGWRFFAGDAPGKTVLGTVSQRSSGPWKLNAVYYGDRAYQLLKASKDLDSLPHVQGQNYNLQMLALPALNLDAFWLVAQPPDPRKDLLVLFRASGEKPIQGLDVPVSVPDFLAALRPLARRVKPATARTGG